MNTTAQHYIDKLGLEPHPEGGYYRQLYGNIDTEGNLVVHNLSPDGEMQVVIQPEEWFAAEILSKNGFCLVGCSVAPAFTFENFELAKKEDLLHDFPQHKVLIERMCR